LHQINIKEAYLNGKLTKEEDICVKQPPEYIEKGAEGKVCYLQKTLYRLKQSEHCWYQKLVNILIHHLGFIHYHIDKTVFYQFIDKDFVVILVHIDNCTIGSNSIECIVHFKDSIQKYVKITNIDKLHWFLGLEITKNHKLHTISISQCSL